MGTMESGLMSTGTEGVTDDLLQLEFHTDDVSNCRRWKVHWEALLRSISTPFTLA